MSEFWTVWAFVSGITPEVVITLVVCGAFIAVVDRWMKAEVDAIKWRNHHLATYAYLGKYDVDFLQRKADYANMMLSVAKHHIDKPL